MVHSEEAIALKSELIECWEKNGVDHPKCVHLIPKFDRGWELDVIAREKYKQEVNSYPNIFNSIMAPEFNKMYFKGTHSTGYWLK